MLRLLIVLVAGPVNPEVEEIRPDALIVVPPLRAPDIESDDTPDTALLFRVTPPI